MENTVGRERPPECGSAELAAARMLRAVLTGLPPTTARDRATARRIEGAATTLETLADHRSNDRF